ncbi:MAG: DUF2330 domain-containing protein, partial [Deltaproteobacteria bacterium]|nr:DUF2330 domain-containing protein [Deltaproteobacteria bacterium]
MFRKNLFLLYSLGLFALSLLGLNGKAQAFCGFYVAKADTKLFNQASKVVLVRDEDRTVITMVSDYQGETKDFAMVVPVPSVLQKNQIHVTENKIIDHLDAYTAPRLVEYFDEDPCQVRRYETMELGSLPMAASSLSDKETRNKTLGVTIEASYTVGEYDILILSAKESQGLETWLKENGYKVPEGASEVLQSYLKQDMKFFVAKVNLKEKTKLGTSYLRPLQMAFESKKFMLPIRLGTVNAKDKQELFIFALSRKGRVESTNYRTIKIPSGQEIPLYIEKEFGSFYKAMFETANQKESSPSVFLEYAWDMAWCDPCAADPLSKDELRELGVFWVEPNSPKPQGRILPISGAQDVFVTRLHVSYDQKTFPEDLKFQTTGDRENFQGRYVLRHPWEGKTSECQEAKKYFKDLPKRFEQEAQNLAKLTRWDIHEIRNQMAAKGQSFKMEKNKNWWEDLWKGEDEKK